MNGNNTEDKQNDTINDTVNLIFNYIKLDKNITVDELTIKSLKSRRTILRAISTLKEQNKKNWFK